MNPPPGKSITSSVADANCFSEPSKNSNPLTGGRFARDEEAGLGMVTSLTSGTCGRWKVVRRRTYGQLRRVRRDSHMDYAFSPKSL